MAGSGSGNGHDPSHRHLSDQDGRGAERVHGRHHRRHDLGHGDAGRGGGDRLLRRAGSQAGEWRQHAVAELRAATHPRRHGDLAVLEPERVQSMGPGHLFHRPAERARRGDREQHRRHREQPQRHGRDLRQHLESDLDHRRHRLGTGGLQHHGRRHGYRRGPGGDLRHAGPRRIWRWSTSARGWCWR